MKKYKTESEFQSDLIRELRKRFPDCLILKNDATYIQGIPDLTIFYQDKWAMLECKLSSKASYRPNQEEYLRMTDDMSFSRTIYPENKEEVLDELQSAFGITR